MGRSRTDIRRRRAFLAIVIVALLVITLAVLGDTSGDEGGRPGDDLPTVTPVTTGV